MKKIMSFLLLTSLLIGLAACATVNPNTATAVTSTAPVAYQSAVTTSEARQNTISALATAVATSIHGDENDYTWNAEDVINIQLNGDHIETTSNTVNINQTQATITAPGTYQLAGNLTDGQIIVNSPDDGKVQLILNNLNINCSNGSAINIIDADKVIIILADGSTNTVSDGFSYANDTQTDDEPNAAIFSMADLSITGNGTLTVEANYNDGIASKDGLVISSGALNIIAVDDGIRGKDYIVIENGNLNIQAGGDGLKADNADDAAKGFITIMNGQLAINAGSDCLDAETTITLMDGSYQLAAGGGYQAKASDTLSTKGIKAGQLVEISGGVYEINTADDAIHANNSVIIHAGVFTLYTGDDGIHADSTLTINGGTINVAASNEGLESAIITLNNGEVNITASDDGINVAAGVDASGSNLGQPGGNKPPRAGGGMGPGFDTFAATGDYWLYINGGNILVNAGGDGLDINGSVNMTGGNVIVNGPTQNMNGALDYDGGFNISGGVLIAAGSAGMAMAPDETSTINTLLVNFNGTLPAGSLFHLADSSDSAVLTFAVSKDAQSIVFSSEQLVIGETYEIWYGGHPLAASPTGYMMQAITPVAHCTPPLLSVAV